MIHRHALDEPHGGRAPSACAVDERRLGALRGDGVEELVRRSGIRVHDAERDAVVAQAFSLCGRAFAFDVRALLGRFPQIDDGDEAHLFDLRHHLGLDRPGTCHDGREAMEIGDAVNIILGDLLGPRRHHCNPGRRKQTRRHQEMRSHAHPPRRNSISLICPCRS